uniref:Sodium/potassium-transporting ATPase subunit beta-1-interacting protein n=1 Tax=Ciona intestinalis TaxID=7719 RepID=F7ARW8_CIOIN|nr:sodium/potassium-transporting ATPase subunit beta-1-interacting protein 3-like [Ciona intestinalis]|eukprot:XP_002132140.1 sodium/potassium-transporting ATPase subunit beta-1-interacting protein 3-like [Ciona intestinalis]
MGCHASAACSLITICVIQLLTISVRQTFDFLALQWGAIVVNFCQIAGVIIGLFGAYRQKRRIIAVYAAWSLIWLGWNLYIILLYFGVGNLSLAEYMVSLNLGLNDNYTWFKTHPVGCAAEAVSKDKFCIYRFEYIEILQSGVQLLLAVIGFSFASYSVGIMKEDERTFDYQVGYRSTIDNKARKSDVNSNQKVVQPLVGSTLNTSSTV